MIERIMNLKMVKLLFFSMTLKNGFRESAQDVILPAAGFFPVVALFDFIYRKFYQTL